MQRAERLVILAISGLLDAAITSRASWPSGTLVVASTALIALGSLGTAVYRTAYILRALSGAVRKP